MTCPDCRRPLQEEALGAFRARRCARCRGRWLDPATFEAICAADPEPGALVAAGPVEPPRAPPRAAPEDRVRYRACPACGEIMSRVNFGRVSGVIVDVCRPHGAWLDAGELAAIRRFLRAGGARRYARWKTASGDRPSAPSRPTREPGYDGPVTVEDLEGKVLAELLRKLAGRAPATARWKLGLSIGLLALGLGLLARVFNGSGSFTDLRWAPAGALFGALCLLGAWDAFQDFRELRELERAERAERARKTDQPTGAGDPR